MYPAIYANMRSHDQKNLKFVTLKTEKPNARIHKT